MSESVLLSETLVMSESLTPELQALQKLKTEEITPAPQKTWWGLMNMSIDQILSLAHDVDAGIQRAVVIFNMFNIETCQSCEGSNDIDGVNPVKFLDKTEHVYYEPTIDFRGGPMEGFKVLAIAREHGLDVKSIQRKWDIIDGEVTGPLWQIIFWRRMDPMSDTEIRELITFYSVD